MDHCWLPRFVAGRMEAGPAWNWDDSFGIFRILENMEAESKDMKADLSRYFRKPFYWLVLSAGLYVLHFLGQLMIFRIACF